MDATVNLGINSFDRQSPEGLILWSWVIAIAVDLNGTITLLHEVGEREHLAARSISYSKSAGNIFVWLPVPICRSCS